MASELEKAARDLYEHAFRHTHKSGRVDGVISVEGSVVLRLMEAVEALDEPEPEAPEGEREPDEIEVETNELPWDRFQRIVADTRDGTRPPTTSDWRWMKQVLTEHFNEPAPPEQTEGDPCPKCGSPTRSEPITRGGRPQVALCTNDECGWDGWIDRARPTAPVRRVSRERWREAISGLEADMQQMPAGDALESVLAWLGVSVEIEGEEEVGDGD